MRTAARILSRTFPRATLATMIHADGGGGTVYDVVRGPLRWRNGPDGPGWVFDHNDPSVQHVHREIVEGRGRGPVEELEARWATTQYPAVPRGDRRIALVAEAMGLLEVRQDRPEPGEQGLDPPISLRAK